MRKIIVLGASAALALGVGCFTSPSQTASRRLGTTGSEATRLPSGRRAEAPALTAKLIRSGTPFRLVTGIGSWHSAFSVLQIDERGRCHYRFEHDWQEVHHGQKKYLQRVWKEVDFTINLTTVGKLRELLAEVDFPQLDKMTTSGAKGGTCFIAKVEAGGVIKVVQCHHKLAISPPLERVFGFVEREILKPNQERIKTLSRPFNYDRQAGIEEMRLLMDDEDFAKNLELMKKYGL
jgi:hypothetical protein